MKKTQQISVTPRWIKILGAVTVVAVVITVILHPKGPVKTVYEVVVEVIPTEITSSEVAVTAISQTEADLNEVGFSMSNSVKFSVK